MYTLIFVYSNIYVYVDVTYKVVFMSLCTYTKGIYMYISQV